MPRLLSAVNGSGQVGISSDGTDLGNIDGLSNNAPLPMMHFRTYERNFNPTDATLFASNSIEPAHQGANIGFNMNNPDGFNVNTRQATFGLGGNEDEIGLLMAPGVWANWSVPVDPIILKMIKFAAYAKIDQKLVYFHEILFIM